LSSTMQPIIHLTLSLLVGAMLARGQKHPFIFTAACGVLGVMPDVDHFIASPAMPVSWLHSGYFLVVAPLMLLVAAFVYDHAGADGSANTQAFALAILVVLSGHLALDIAAGHALPVAFPVETGTFAASQAVLLYAGKEPFVTASDLPLAFWAAFGMVAFACVAWASAPADEESAEPWYSLVRSRLVSGSRPQPV
jgi:hypothetical protein